MATGFPDWCSRSVSSANEEDAGSTAVTDAGASVSFTTTVHSWRIYNDGPNATYYLLTGAAATTKNKLPAKAWIMEDVPTDIIYFVCDTDETSTVYVTGVR